MGSQRSVLTKIAHTDRQTQTAIAHKSSIPKGKVAHPLLQLQQQAGNQAVSHLIQTKLKVGKPNDAYEAEADRVADKVMRMPEPLVQRQTEENPEETAQSKPIGTITPLIQRQGTEEKDETAQTLQRQGMEDEEETAQTKGTADATPTVTPILESRIQSMRTGGQPLPESSRTFFESRFGYDFGGVRLHTDSQADEASQNLNAQAFTLGQNIFFASGRYEPDTSQGKWLLAHELTHTVQQQPPQSLPVNPPTVRSKQIGITSNPSGSIARKVGSASPTSPAQDPGFQAVVGRAKKVTKKQKSHPPAKTKAAEAQAAAKSPANEVASKAAGNQVGQMDRQQPKPFDRKAFKAALSAKIAATAPKTLEEADEFKEKGKLNTVKGDLTGQVDTSKKQSQGAVEEKVKGTPSTSGIESKSVTPLPPTEKGSAPGNIGATQAVPKPKTASEVSLQEGSQSLDQKMKEGEVTEDQLKKSNEPDFKSAADAKKEAQTDAVTAPKEYRQQEQSILDQAQGQAKATAQTGLTSMQGTRGKLLKQVTGSQQKTQSKDEQERARVANEIQAIYNETKQKAEACLSRLDTEVNQAFDQGATEAQKAFEDYVESRMDDYKDDRYDRLGGSILWAKDKLFGMPSEVNAFYQEGRTLYIKKMDAVLDRVAILVETGLNEAKDEIAKGRKAVQDHVNKQPDNLRKAAQESAKNIQSQFDELEQSVNDKQNQLIESLAQKYNEKLQAVDARIDEMKAANRGLVDKALDAVVGVIKTILALKDLLLGVLAKAAGAIKKIIKNPIGFLGNLVAGVKQGFMNFVGNIVEHLQKGVMGWLFGAMAEAGIQLPESFDLKGILTLILQVLGMTYNFIRARAVKIFGEKVVKAMEAGAEIFQVLITKGVAGLWEYIKEQVTNLADVVIEGIKSFVSESIIKAGITWIIGLLNPAGAFIKACKAIYDIIIFFVERGSQIMALVNAVLDSVSAIADGAIGAAASAVENALAKAVPVVISFLAALLGVGGISEKIRSIITKIQAPISKAIDWVINKAYNLVKAAGKLLGFGKDKKGKPDERTPAQKERDLNDAIREARRVVSHPNIKAKTVESQFVKLEKQYRLTKLELQATKGFVLKIHGEVNPNRDDSVKFSGADDIESAVRATITRTQNALKAKPNPAFSTEIQKLERDIRDTVILLDGTTGFDFFVNVERLLALKVRAQDLETQVKSGATAPTGGSKSPAEVIEEILDSGKAKHISASTYKKHWNGTTEEERRQNSESGGPGQFLYSMSNTDVQKLEREALLNPDRIEDKVSTYHVFKTFSQIIGYANGKKTSTLRAEITAINSAAPSIHSHPR